MKNFLFILCIFTFFTSCKPTSSIITSKELAKEKGLYSAPKTTISKSVVPKKKEVTKTFDRKVAAKKNDAINEKEDNDLYYDKENTSYLVKQLINEASDNLGVNYRSGGTTKEGFDCSGLMYATFQNFDIKLPRSSFEMAKVGRKLEENDIKKGDLIFFKTNGKSRINHVGMVVEINDDEIKFIHSSTQSGVIISSTKEAYYKKTFAQVNRILE